MGAFKGGSNWRGYVMGMVTMSPATVHRGKRSVLASKLVRSKCLNLFLLCNFGSKHVSSSETYLKPSQLNREMDVFTSSVKKIYQWRKETRADASVMSMQNAFKHYL